MKKRFVVDTNVLIYDPSCIFKLGEENDVLIPIGVIEELDKFKKGTDGKGYASRQAIAHLDKITSKSPLEALGDGVPLDSGGRLFIRVDLNKPSFSDQVDENYTDNKTLQICLEEQARIDKSGEEVMLVLLTKDMALRIKSKVLEVESQDYQQSIIQDLKMYDVPKTIILDPSDMAELHAYDTGIVVESCGLQINEYAYAKCKKTDTPTPIRLYPDGHIRAVFNHKGCYGISPKNEEQHFLFDALLDDSIKMVAVSGRAGTGKTLVSIAGALEKVVNGVGRIYEQAVIIKPVIPVGREVGFLPGSLEEKMEPWMAPIKDNLEVLHTSSKKAWEDLRFQGWLEIQVLSYIRGRSIPKRYIIVDEAQNLNKHEIKTIISRAGMGTKIVLTGDPYQIDNPYLDIHSNGMAHLIKQFQGENIFASVTLMKGERSELAELAALKL